MNIQYEIKFNIICYGIHIETSNVKKIFLGWKNVLSQVIRVSYV